MKMSFPIKKEDWKVECQDFEFGWWKGSGWKKSIGPYGLVCDEMNKRVLGFSGDEFGDGDKIIDVGAGPDSRCLRMFPGSSVVIIEPLADKYREFNGNSYQKERIEHVYSQPVEEHIPELDGTADLCWAWGVLDHGYNPEMSVSNMYKYLKTDGWVYLCVALDKPHKGHPGVGNKDVFIAFIQSMFSTVEWGDVPENGLWVKARKI